MQEETGRSTMLFLSFGVPQMHTVGWWWVWARVLFKAGWNIVSVYCMLLWLNPGVRGEHPTSQLLETVSLPSVTCVCLVDLVDELVLGVRSGLCIVVLVLWRVGAIPRNECVVQGQNCVAVHQGSEKWARFNYRNWIYTYILVKLGVDTSGA